MSELELNRTQYLELEKIGLGAFDPLDGFMNEDDFHAVVDRLRLTDGRPFPLPVALDTDQATAERLRSCSSVDLSFEGRTVGELEPLSFYTPDKSAAAKQIFGTSDRWHPGVDHFFSMGDVFVGGPVRLTNRAALDISEFELTPEETKATIRDKGLKTVVGFQTRNVPHRAHEHLQRIALEQVDGLLIQPLVGRKMVGDFTPQAIMTGYRCLIEEFLPTKRIVLATLSTAMRYAGPREALFHALIRRNYGCTHFVVGRDHAGVGNFYGKYDAHRLAEEFGEELGIEIMRLRGPHYCLKCDGVVTDRTCPHEETGAEFVRYINGADMRSALKTGQAPDPRLMRPEIVESLKDTQLFIEEAD